MPTNIHQDLIDQLNQTFRELYSDGIKDLIHSSPLFGKSFEYKLSREFTWQHENDLEYQTVEVDLP